MICRGCGSAAGSTVLDLGRQPAADGFPPTTDGGPDALYQLSMWLCSTCQLAQLVADDTDTDEPRGVEPMALVRQSEAALDAAADAGWIRRGSTVREFPSPHGGSWLDPARRHGLREISDGPADVLIDSFGIMHDADQRAAFARRAELLQPGGVLLLQFQSLAGIMRSGQWTALRHGHFGYYSMPALTTLLGAAGLRIAHVWHFDLYGGTDLAAVVHVDDTRATDLSVERALVADRAAGVTDPAALGRLHDAFTEQVAALRSALDRLDRPVYGYGAASRAVALLAAAQVTRAELRCVADAAPAKLGRRMPGTDVPIVTPEALIAQHPDLVVLFLPDLRAEVEAALPALAGTLRDVSRIADGIEPGPDQPA